MQFVVHHTTGKHTTLEASDVVFAGKVNKKLMAQAIRVYLANQRQGTAKVKTRSEINRTKAKWFKQKGTGNARHGARTPNIFVGGGVSHGPTGTQNWSLVLPKQMKRMAMISALSAQQEHIVVTTVLSDIQPKTKDAIAFLSKLAPDSKRILVVTHEEMPNITRSMNNLRKVVLTTADHLNIYEISNADKIIITKEAVKMVEMRLTKKEIATVKAEKTEIVAVEEKPLVVVEKKAIVKKSAVAKKAPAVKKAVAAKKPAVKAVKKVAKAKTK